MVFPLTLFFFEGFRKAEKARFGCRRSKTLPLFIISVTIYRSPLSLTQTPINNSTLGCDSLLIKVTSLKKSSNTCDLLSNKRYSMYKQAAELSFIQTLIATAVCKKYPLYTSPADPYPILSPIVISSNGIQPTECFCTKLCALATKGLL